MRETVIAVDIGGTKTVVALADRDAHVIDAVTAPTPAAEGPDAVIGTVARLAREVVARTGSVSVRGAGVGTAGVVDTATGTIISATDTFAEWPGTPVAALLRRALGALLAPEAVVFVQNDVDAHAQGEGAFGAAAGAASALVVAVGTGIGAGILLDGRPLRGAHGVAGELAHVPVPGAEGLRCPCGRPGHLEALGSGVGMHRRYLALGGDPSARDARAVARRAADGELIAQRALAESAEAVGRAIAGAATLLDPERVVITGGVPGIGDAWWTPMRDAYRAEAIDALGDLPVVPGRLGGEAPLRGAAVSVWERIGESS